MSIGLMKALRGLVIVLVGLLVTWFSYSMASSGQVPGGTYFITGGAFLFGGLDIITGLYKHMMNK